jgi:hypothetical protein
MAKILVLAAAVPLLFGPSARADDNKPQPEPQPVSTECTQPVPERRYTDDTLIYLLSVDLTDCDWWNGSPIQLEASLERVDGTEGHGAWSGALCGVDFTVRPDTGDGSSTQATARSKSGTCDVQVAIDHPAVEAAYYRAEVSFPRDGGRRTLSFTALCGQPAGCVDVPVDPMPTLAHTGDMAVGDDDTSSAD